MASNRIYWDTDGTHLEDTVNGDKKLSDLISGAGIADATASTKGLATAAQITKLNGIEAGADVTDATNVDAAGATMNTDTNVKANSWVIDEDTLVTNTDQKVPTQQSVKAYIDTLLAAFQSGGDFLDIPATATRVSDTQFTMPDVGNANKYDLLLSQGTALIWLESTTFQVAITETATYASDVVTVNIIGNSLTAGFTSMQYSVDKAKKEEFIIPGTIATGTDLAKTFYMPCAGYIIAADGYHKTAGTTNSTTYDINDDGGTLFSSKLTIATTATTATLLSATDPSTLIAKDSLITIDCDSVSTTAPVEAYIYVYWIPASWRYIA